MRSSSVQAHVAAEETAGIDVAEHHQGIGDRRLCAAAAITSRSRSGTGRPGPTRRKPIESTQPIEPPPAVTDSMSTIGKAVQIPIKSPRVRRRGSAL